MWQDGHKSRLLSARVETRACARHPPRGARCMGRHVTVRNSTRRVRGEAGVRHRGVSDVHAVVVRGHQSDRIAPMIAPRAADLRPAAPGRGRYRRGAGGGTRGRKSLRSADKALVVIQETFYDFELTAAFTQAISDTEATLPAHHAPSPRASESQPGSGRPILENPTSSPPPPSAGWAGSAPHKGSATTRTTTRRNRPTATRRDAPLSGGGP